MSGQPSGQPLVVVRHAQDGSVGRGAARIRPAQWSGAGGSSVGQEAVGALCWSSDHGDSLQLGDDVFCQQLEGFEVVVARQVGDYVLNSGADQRLVVADQLLGGSSRIWPLGRASSLRGR